MIVNVDRLPPPPRKKVSTPLLRSDWETYKIYSTGCNVCGKPFVQPKVGPPFHRDEITEPLVSQFVGDNFGHSVHVIDRCNFRIDQQRRLSIRMIFNNKGILKLIIILKFNTHY